MTFFTDREGVNILALAPKPSHFYCHFVLKESLAISFYYDCISDWESEVILSKIFTCPAKDTVLQHPSRGQWLERMVQTYSDTGAVSAS